MEGKYKVGNYTSLPALTIHRESSLVGTITHSCCNMTAYMDDVVISQYCVGYYYAVGHSNNGPFSFSDEKWKFPRSPAVVFRPSTSNPVLSFNVVCPAPDATGRVPGLYNPALISVSLVPRCTCVEEDRLESLQSQPCNAALNGNFADFDDTQENVVSGWISQESWRSQVLAVPYIGQAPADDTSNNVSV
jgi:hypothetical protein